MHGSSALDYDAVPASLADAAVTPGDPAYGRLTLTYFRGGAPGIVLLPRTVEQVVDAVDFAGCHLPCPALHSAGQLVGGVFQPHERAAAGAAAGSVARFIEPPSIYQYGRWTTSASMVEHGVEVLEGDVGSTSTGQGNDRHDPDQQATSIQA